ncbi:cytochrome-c peroxidase [Sphingomonas sp. MMS24-J13]|uniref:cytochrome-c peroxidase n=1 Tax=Sphingomonas sp. MMS24-J13 TaxID=3238686 RepID=UPI00384F538F
MNYFVRALLLAGVLVAGGARSVQPLSPADNLTTPAKAELGRRLFYDADLSIDGTMACATCHEQHRGFADGNSTHPGVHGDPARRNVPGLANVAWFKSYTWGDPRIRTLEAQVLVPVLGESPVEMGMKGQEVEIARRLSRDECYRHMFAEAFPKTGGRIDMAAVAQALAAFERTLVSYDAPQDRGAPRDPVAQQGAVLFRRDCVSCHTGVNFTDGRFHNVTGWVSRDRGLGEVSERFADNGAFRTPSLRNVAVTEPYFHDGSAPSLEDALRRHAGVQERDIPALVAFLKTLTDEAFLNDRRFGLPGEACGKRL